MSGPYRHVSKADPCLICGKPDWCAVTPGGWIRCERIAVPPAGWELVRGVGSGGLFKPVVDATTAARGNGRARSPRPKATSATTPKVPDFGKIGDRAKAAITPEQKAGLAATIGVTVAALDAIGVGWLSADELRTLGAGFAGEGPYPDGAFTFPERDSSGRVVGLSLRAVDGRKGSPSDAARGLIVPNSLHQRPDPVLVLEGASDVAACEVLGLAASGRPSNSGGAEYLAKLLDGREVIIVGENDAKDTGQWPGRDGAKSVALRMTAERGEPVRWTLPPTGSKDIRDYFLKRVADGLDLGNPEACRAAGQELLAALKARAKKIKAPKKSQADHLVDLACEMFRLGRDESDSAFAVRKSGPNIAIPFAGGRDALRRQIAKSHRAATKKTPSASALGDALVALGGMADDAPREAVHLRVARHEGNIIIDLGDETGRAVVVSPDGWNVADQSPVLFRRTALTAAMPVPERGGDLDELFILLNVAAQDRVILKAWLVAAMIADLAHAILLLTGLQGAGKSTAERMLATLIDPSPSALRSPPRDPEGWAVTTAASWCVAVDNVSVIPPWWSDALCRAVSGDGWLTREFYTNKGVSVLAYRRVVIMSSIDPGSLRGDLADRLLGVELEPIPDHRRRSETDILAAFEAARPALLGALLDVVAVALRRLPDVHLDQLPRMADFGLILAALDEEYGTSGLDVYLGQRDRVATDIIEGDPVGQAIVTVVTNRWTGTSTELLSRIKPERPGPEWPRNGRAMSGRLRRLIPALSRLGLKITPPSREAGTGQRIWTLEKSSGGPSQPSHRHGNPPDAIEIVDSACDDPCDGRADDESNRHTDRHGENPPDAIEIDACDDRDGRDGRNPVLSGGDGHDPATVPDGWTESEWAAACAADAAATEASDIPSAEEL